MIEKLTKFTGDHHEMLTPGEYTQLTGRAGRRGIDDLGTAVVLWSPFVSFEQVAELASSRAFHLQVGVPADVQHGRQPGARVHARAGPPPAQPVVRAVPVRPRRRAPRGAARERSRPDSTSRGSWRSARSATSGSTGPSVTPNERRGHDEAASREAALAALRPGDVVNVAADAPADRR